jgi:hypothetical protein
MSSSNEPRFCHLNFPSTDIIFPAATSTMSQVSIQQPTRQSLSMPAAQRFQGAFETKEVATKLKWEVERLIVCVSTFGWMFQPFTNFVYHQTEMNHVDPYL